MTFREAAGEAMALAKMKARPTINGYQLHIPKSGGKAGKGCNKTGSVQLRADGLIHKQFRFVVGDTNSFHKAMEKAKAFAASNPR